MSVDVQAHSSAVPGEHLSPLVGGALTVMGVLLALSSASAWTGADANRGPPPGVAAASDAPKARVTPETLPAPRAAAAPATGRVVPPQRAVAPASGAVPAPGTAVPRGAAATQVATGGAPDGAIEAVRTDAVAVAAPPSIPVAAPPTVAVAPVTVAAAQAPQLCRQRLGYAVDATEPEPGDRKALDTLVAWLASHPEVRVTVRAHADGAGSTRHNFALSERRAAWIAALLKQAGVSAARTTVQAFGEYVPLEEVAAEDASNRRTDVVLRGLPPGVLCPETAGGANDDHGPEAVAH